MTSLPPVAKRIPYVRAFHGDTFVDQYEWMRDRNDPDVIAYLDAENAYAAARTEPVDALRAEILDEFRTRTGQSDQSVPTRKGDWWYHSRTVEGKSYELRCRRPVAAQGDWTPPSAFEDDGILFDGNAEADGHEFFELGAFEISPHGGTLAYSVDLVGDERFTLHRRDIVTGTSTEVASETGPSVVWSPDGRYLFYVTVDGSARQDRVWRHDTESSTPDVLVFHEPDPGFDAYVSLTRSRKYLLIGLYSQITSEWHVLDAADPSGDFHVILPRRHGVEYKVDHAVVHGLDRFLLLHNDSVDGWGRSGDKADNFLLAEAPVDDPTDQTIVIPHRSDVRLSSVDAFAEHLVVLYRRDTVTRLAVSDLRGGYGDFRELVFDEDLYIVRMIRVVESPEWSQPTFRFLYTSYSTPWTVYDFDFESGELYCRKVAVVAGFDSAHYVQSREWAMAADGVRVPVSLVKRRGLPDGPAPTLLLGYGAYESSVDPYFDTDRLSLLDRGVVFAVAHVRGGGELGREWYDNGKKLTKKNTFTDFVAVAQHLVDTGVTAPDRFVATGGSAGGLLAGVVANIAPGLFSGILADVPFVDPLTSMLDPSHPQTVSEWDEWGDPLHDEDVYAYVKSYSPYENVTAQNYPPILALTSLNDTRVLYVEPAKWIAALRFHADDSSGILLKTDMHSGHGGASGRYERWAEVAYEYAWILRQCGVQPS